MRYRVFLSHATPDKWLAKVLCQKIETAGAEVFRDDRSIEAGEDIPERIRLAIADSNELVVLLTPYSVNRPWVLLEVGAAWGRGDNVRIIAIRQHIEIEPIPGILKAKKVIDLNEFDDYIAELKTRIKVQHDDRN